MDGLTHLSVLLSLNLSNNRIVKIAAMSSLTMLRHLSLHGNQITSLTGAPPQYEIGPTAQTQLELQFVWNLTTCQCMDVCTHACLMSWGATDRVLFMPVQFLHQQQGHMLLPVHVGLHLSASH